MSCAIKSAFAALILGVSLAPAAFAQTPVEPQSRNVAYGDLDMSTVSGGEILLKRISSAAKKVCARSVVRSPVAPRDLALCRHDTVAAVVEGLGIGTLTRAFNNGHAQDSRFAERD